MTANEMVVGPHETWPDEKAMARAELKGGSFALLKQEQDARRAELPKAAGFHRLPLSWYKEKVKKLKADARARGVDGGIFLTNRWNIIYASGLFHVGTERPFACFFPMDQEDAVIWFYPYLDDELVRSWWFTDGYHFFDYPHAEGKPPYQGSIVQGRTVDIFSWWGNTLSKLGYGNKTVGLDAGALAEIGILPGQEDAERLDFSGKYTVPGKFRPEGGAYGLMAKAMPEAQFVDVWDILMRNRVVKDDMEIALTQRAMDYCSQIHAFARNYIIEKGIGVLDREVANAVSLWGAKLIMQDIGGESSLHGTAGTEVNWRCCAGPLTAYPHPPQITTGMYYHPIQPGQPVRFAPTVTLGGYGGELQRSFLIAPWTEWQEKVWQVNTRSHYIQAEESYAGNLCSNVAKAVHEYQVANGCAHLIYHRPGHGMGMEGHQPPYQALGDYTVMQKGMYFSNEPGLFDPKNGFGVNSGNNILVADKRGLQTGTVPCTREWCLLKL